MVVAVTCFMLLMKTRQARRGERHIQLVSLAEVANIDAALKVNFAMPAFITKLAPGLPLERLVIATDRLEWEPPANPKYDGARVILDYIADQNTVSRERARHDGDQHPRNAEALCEVARMQAAGASKGDQREFARVVASFDGDQPQGPLHTGVDNPDHAFRKALQRHRRSLLLEPFP